MLDVYRDEEIRVDNLPTINFQAPFQILLGYQVTNPYGHFPQNDGSKCPVIPFDTDVAHHNGISGRHLVGTKDIV